MTTTNTTTSGAADLPEALRKSALEIFDGHECSQDVRDAIEWASGFAQAWLDETDATHLRELTAYRLTVENLEREIAAQQPAPSAAAVDEVFLRSVITLCNNRGASPESIENFDSDDRWIADLWRQAEHLIATAPQPTPTPQADGQPAPVVDREAVIRAAVAAMPHTNPMVADDLLGGFTMHTEADDVIAIFEAGRAARAPADPAGDNFGSSEHWKEKAQYWAAAAHRMRQEALRGEPVDGIVHPKADSVQEDAMRLDYLHSTGSTIEMLPGEVDFYPMRFRVGGLRSAVSPNLREAIDIARKQGATP